MKSTSAFDTHWLVGHGGLRLRLVRWHGESVPERRSLICTGRNEPIDKYLEVAQNLVARGFEVWGMDWRGQGGSEREVTHAQRGHVGTFDSYLADLTQVVDGPLGGCVSVLVAHSMGGHVALRFAHDRPGSLRALVLSAPMIAIDTGPLPAFAIAWLARRARRIGLGESYLPGHQNLMQRAARFKGNPLTSDRERFEHNFAFLRRHPELVTGGATWGWLAAAADSMAMAQKRGFAETITAPTLILSGEEDRVVSGRAHRTYTERIPHATLVMVPGARHEILVETDERLSEVWAAIDRFLATLPAEPKLQDESPRAPKGGPGLGVAKPNLQNELDRDA
ncbi:MAG: alpha/beta hydrolase [Myxococcota bacterium]